MIAKYIVVSVLMMIAFIYSQRWVRDFDPD